MNFFYFTKRNISTEMTNEHILLELQRIFYIHLLTNDLYLYNNEKKMMDMLRSESGENWDTNTILNLAMDNKIIWIRGLGDPLDPDKYQKIMNDRLAEILKTK